jgi:hypothetical protein
MDKKDLLAIVNAIIEKVQEKNGISEGEARALVGMTLRVSSEAVAGACEVRKVALSQG